MSDSKAALQAADVCPPRAGRVLAISAVTTSYTYDLHTVALAQYTETGTDALSEAGHIYLCFQADNDDVYILFDDSSSVACVPTAQVTANSGLAYSTGACMKILKNLPAEQQPVRISRKGDRYLAVKAATNTATLRVIVNNVEPGKFRGRSEV